YYKVGIEQLVVVHDELDLELGTIRLKTGGGDGGNKGIKSIAEQLKTKDFCRLRMGIGRPAGVSPQEGQDKQKLVSSWVLGRFTKLEREIADSMIERGILALNCLIES